MLEGLFKETAELVDAVLGSIAFSGSAYSWGSFDWVQRSTVVAYDPIMAGSAYLLDARSTLRRRRADIVSALPDFYEKSAGLFDGRKTNASDIDRRDQAFLIFLRSFTL